MKGKEAALILLEGGIGEGGELGVHAATRIPTDLRTVDRKTSPGRESRGQVRRNPA